MSTNVPRSTPNGLVLTLRAHGYTAQVATVGAAVASLEYQGRALVRSFDPDGVRPVYAGALLAPWPNRVIDARYSWDGAEHQLAITEPARGHALHGLVVNTDFQLVEHSESSVQLSALIPVQEGYPAAVRLDVEFTLGSEGLRTVATATNHGPGEVPFGWGSHSYLVAPGGSVDEWILHLPAENIQLTEGERLIPQGTVRVREQAPELDFQTPRPLGSTFIDHAYTGLAASSAGIYRVSVTDATGAGSQMTWDQACPWVQIHTADRPEPELNRTGLAVEPMTCPPDAFNSGADVVRLVPGASHEAAWTIGAVGAADSE
ncbi:aldose 1-epimerase family protein [Glutamicibacter sp. NPDC087344]|uniref:aldose 1-epimerase family protein n=1 Tax=Glutamicibacter sp. NPDC087344 TaxID=3363994 RepID=UPI00380E8971